MDHRGCPHQLSPGNLLHKNKQAHQHSFHDRIQAHPYFPIEITGKDTEIPERWSSMDSSELVIVAQADHLGLVIIHRRVAESCAGNFPVNVHGIEQVCSVQKNFPLAFLDLFLYAKIKREAGADPTLWNKIGSQVNGGELRIQVLAEVKSIVQLGGAGIHFLCSCRKSVRHRVEIIHAEGIDLVSVAVQVQVKRVPRGHLLCKDRFQPGVIAAVHILENGINEGAA